MQAPATRSSLLVRLGDPRDAEAWAQFVDLYAPIRRLVFLRAAWKSVISEGDTSWIDPLIEDAEPGREMRPKGVGRDG